MNPGHIKEKILKSASEAFDKMSKSPSVFVNRFCYALLVKPFELSCNLKVFRIVSADDYSAKYGTKVQTIRKDRKGYVANAVHVGMYRVQELYESPLPDMNLYRFESVTISRGSDLILDIKRRIAIDDYIATKNDDNKTYEDAVTKCQWRNIAIVRLGKKKKSLSAGIMINGQYSFNYYHNMYENLIRLLPLKEVNEVIPSEASVIIDSDIVKYESLKRAYEILSGGLKRNTEVITKEDLFAVGQLYCISDVNYIVPSHANFQTGNETDYIFDKEFTFGMRNELLHYKSHNIFPKRIFITRNNTAHRHFNEDKLFGVLESYGFEKVAPENYSMEDQMKMFNDAEWIIGGSGAAFTNLMFCSEDCNIVCVKGYTSYVHPVFVAPVCFVKARMRYFMTKNGFSAMFAHSSFTIDVEEFRTFVENNISRL